MKKILLALVAVSFLSGCASSSVPTKLQTSDPRECAQNFTYTGSFLAGRTYKTNAYVPKVNQETAITRAARLLTADGWQINNTDTKLGIISASQTVSYGQGKSVPLNVAIAPADKGVNVSISYATSGGVTSPLDAIQRQFCSIVSAIEGK